MFMVTVVFWASAAMIVYPYAIYPWLVWVIGWIRPRPIRREPWTPAVTTLIAAYNESCCIGETIAGMLAQDYPKLELIVISDGSTDGTDEVVRQFTDRGVLLLRRDARQGKAAALNEAMKSASGQIIVFSDANSLFAPDAISRLVENFADPQVGYVTGNLGFVTRGGRVTGGSAFMRYENGVRALETRAGSIIGVNGGVDAIRRELYVDIPPQLITDFVLPLHVIGTGHRVIYDERVRSRETANKEIVSEFRMRVRVALRAMHGMVYMRRLLNFRRFPAAAFSLVSHKLLRYGAFVFMPLALGANAVLATSSDFYLGLLGLQLLLYLLALIGLRRNLPATLRALTVVPMYFVVSNVAFAWATLKFLRGENRATWEPRAG